MLDELWEEIQNIEREWSLGFPGGRCRLLFLHDPMDGVYRSNPVLLPVEDTNEDRRCVRDRKAGCTRPGDFAIDAVASCTYDVEFTPWILSTVALGFGGWCTQANDIPRVDDIRRRLRHAQEQNVPVFVNDLFNLLP